ncbi:DUF6766 family protein [Streptomyces sp. PmtA]
MSDDSAGRSRRGTVILSVCLRQRGSPESTPVGAAHSSTGVEG